MIVPAQGGREASCSCRSNDSLCQFQVCGKTWFELANAFLKSLSSPHVACDGFSLHPFLNQKPSHVLTVSDGRGRRHLRLGILQGRSLELLKWPWILMEVAVEQLGKASIVWKRIWQENCCKSRIINMGRLCLLLQKLFLFSVTRGRSYSCVLLCVASVVKLLFYLWKTKSSWTWGTAESTLCKQWRAALFWSPNKILVDCKDCFQGREVAWPRLGSLNSAPLLGDTVQNNAQAEITATPKWCLQS